MMIYLFNVMFFIDCGIMMSIHTVTIGYKKYLFKSFVDGFSVLSAQRVCGMGGVLISDLYQLD